MTTNAMKVFVATAAATLLTNVPAHAQEAADGMQLEEVVVTARHRVEKLQDVPDAITAFTSADLERAGVQKIGEVVALTPNFTFNDASAFSGGDSSLSMRGVGNSPGGWPSVTFVVDGVPAASSQSIHVGSLVDIERIEILRGPQSALYGAGAIAGAINVMTKKPTDELEGRVRAAYGNGNDRQLEGTISGGLVPDTLLGRLTASYREADGLIESTSNGINLDFKRRQQLQGRLLILPTDNVEIDLNATYVDERVGSGYMDRVPSVDYIDDFSSTYRARRGSAGTENRELFRSSMRIEADFGGVVLRSVTAYTKLEQLLSLSVCYDDPDDPLFTTPDGGADCLLAPAYGAAAAPGGVMDNYYIDRGDTEMVSQDIRLESDGSGSWQWLIGASALRREADGGFDIGLVLAPDASLLNLGPTYNGTKDRWWGVYGQVSVHPTERTEFTVAARYDDHTYESTTYTDSTYSTVVPVFAPDGSLIDTQERGAQEWQPKAQFSFHATEDVMLYTTISRGFRAGYFNNGAFTLPETTTNYEIGIKSELADRSVIANAAVFRIDYSDQQFFSLISEPPYSTAFTIPKTQIDGVEADVLWRASRYLTLGLSAGYLDAKVDDGTRSPSAPKFTGNATMDFTLPVGAEWEGIAHVDYRYSSSLYLATQNQERVPAKDFLNARVGMKNDAYEVSLFVRNATDTRQADYVGAVLPTSYLRFQNQPRSYGIELTVSFD